MKTKINQNSIRGLLCIPLLLGCIAILPGVQAAPDPAPPPGANTRDGQGAMAHITTGQFNTAFGTNALNSLTTGNNNAGQGNSALFSLTTGGQNIGVGNLALRLTTTGSQNVGVGAGALYSNVTGTRNTAVGHSALQSSTKSDNTAVGWLAGYSNTTGIDNVAVGSEALQNNQTGSSNTAIGYQSMLNNSNASFNTAVGSLSLLSNTSGAFNVAIGRRALQIATGANNTVLGYNAGARLVAGDGNVFLGISAGNNYPNTAGDSPSNIICIKSSGDGTSDTSNRCFIGNIRGVTVGNSDGINVVIDSDGQLGTVSSSRRFKKDIKPMDQISEAILALKPVTFHYKNQDTKKAGDTPQFGLIAEDVAAVNPDLAVRDADGQLLTVRYDAVNAMLLNEFIKEHQRVKEQQASIADLRSTVALQRKGMEVFTAQLKEQASQIQKVSAQIELHKTVPRTVAQNK